MHLDVRTLFVVATLLGALLGAGTLVSTRARRHEPSLRYWAAANFAFVVAGALLSLRGLIPDAASIVVANTIVVFAMAAIWAGILTFDRRAPVWWPIAFSATATAALLAYWTFVVPSLPARVTVMSVVGTVYGASWVRALLRRGAGGVARRVMLGICAAHTVFAAVRAVLAPRMDPTLNIFTTSGVPTWVGVEFVLFVVAFNAAVLAMINDRLIASLDRLASVDPLTEALTRRAFMDRATRTLHRAARDGQGVVLMLVDVDHFKAINDRYGHLAGDAVLKQLVMTVTQRLRPSDFVGRFGGEEFALILPGATAAHAQLLAERVRMAVEAMTVSYGKHTVRVTASAGVACYPSNGVEVEVLIAAADAALYRAKHAGRNRSEMAPSPTAADQERLSQPAAQT